MLAIRDGSLVDFLTISDFSGSTGLYSWISLASVINVYRINPKGSTEFSKKLTLRNSKSPPNSFYRGVRLKNLGLMQEYSLFLKI